MTTNFSFDDGGIESNLRHFDERFADDVKQVFNHAAKYSTAYMKAKAPWNDRTTRARKGLKGVSSYDRPSKQYGITLAGEAPYQIFLETKDPNNGGRPILWPTAKVVGQYTMRALEHILDRNISVAGIFPAVPGRSGRGGTRGMPSYGRRNQRTRRAGSQTVRNSRR